MHIVMLHRPVVIARGAHHREVASIVRREDGAYVLIERGKPTRVANDCEVERWLAAQADAATLAA